MDVEGRNDERVSRVAAVMGEPARARMLFCLMDSCARTSTELAVVADVSPSTASVHLNRLKQARLVKVLVQGKHRYYSLAGADVANVLESMSVLAGGSQNKFVPGTPNRLVAARTCYDHIAGKLGVSLHDRLVTLEWLATTADGENAYDLTPKGTKMFDALGLDVEEIRSWRRRLAFACLDWSERRPHVGGAIGAALLKLALRKNWVSRDLDSRALSVTRYGQRAMLTQFGLRV